MKLPSGAREEANGFEAGIAPPPTWPGWIALEGAIPSGGITMIEGTCKWVKKKFH